MAPTTNGAYYGDGYDDYNAFSPTTQRSNSAAWKPGTHPVQLNGSAYDDVDYNTPLEERASYQISLNTKMREHNLDTVSKHLLFETALLDSQEWEILTMEELDALKKEHERLDSRVEAAQRKLAFEVKVKDAAQNLQRLYTASSKNRSDTPQSPDSPKKGRRSLLGQRTSSGGSLRNEGKTLSQTEDELAASTRKVEALNDTVKRLLERRQYVERKLLRHTAAILAEQREQQAADTANSATNGHRGFDDDSSSLFAPDEFDGIRDILVGCEPHSLNKLQKLGTSRKIQEEYENQLHSMQARLEQLNNQLRNVISEASKSRGASLPPEPQYGYDEEQDTATRLNSDFDRLENNLRALQQEQHDSQKHYEHIEEKEHRMRNAVEDELEGINTQLHNTLMLSPAAQSIPDLQEPPQSNGQGYKPQLAYLEESLLNIEHLLRRHGDELQAARDNGGDSGQEIEEIRAQATREVLDAQSKAATQAHKMSEYETTVSGLWEIMQSDQPTARSPTFETTPDAPPRSPLFESFSLQAFSSRVQHLFDRASSAREQHDILRRQIQQQRELNGKSDAEKDRQIEDLNTKHETLIKSHADLQEELTKAVAISTQSESEASHLRAEMLNIGNELDELKRTADLRHQEREDMVRQMQTHEQESEELRQQIEDLNDDARIFSVESEAKLKEAEANHTDLTSQLTAAVGAREAADQKHATVNQDMENLESEVVRLTTELTMAKAELDGAYGSRAERAKEAQVSEIQALNDRNAQTMHELEGLRSSHSQLETEIAALRTSSDDNARTAELEHELQVMAAEFQDLTRESMQLERERGQLDALIDGLRERCEALEGQLSDERVRWIGIKSPSAAAGGRESIMAREMTSTTVLRQEFKKMMRETRAEGVRLLRAEQEERRKLENEVRRLRHGNSSGAMSRSSALSVNGHGHGRGASTGSSTPA